MTSLVNLTALVIEVFLLALAITVVSKLLNGAINTRHLLSGRRADGKFHFSAERVQLLVFTIWVALSYLLHVAENRTAGKLPDIELKTLALLSGSHALYLSGKAYSLLFKKTDEGGI